MAVVAWTSTRPVKLVLPGLEPFLDPGPFRVVVRSSGHVYVEKYGVDALGDPSWARVEGATCRPRILEEAIRDLAQIPDPEEGD